MAVCMIVDDSEAIRRVGRSIFQFLKHEARCAADGPMALDACKAGMPDVVLVDWQMPKMTGVEVIAAFRARPDGKRARILYCTTENDSVDLVKAMAAGADDYLIKPFDCAEVAAKLKALGI
jgi:two-component system, chemotaxis family, chemotaxis protein CheY